MPVTHGVTGSSPVRTAKGSFHLEKVLFFVFNITLLALHLFNILILRKLDEPILNFHITLE